MFPCPIKTPHLFPSFPISSFPSPSLSLRHPSMWPSDSGERNTNRHSLGHINHSSKLPPSSSSSSSSTSPTILPHRKTMEEVWKDINLPTLLLQDTHPSTSSLSLDSPLPHKPAAAAATSSSSTATFRSIILQDFLAGAFKDPPTASAAAAASGQTPRHLPLPPTVLSLSNSGFHCPDFWPARPNSPDGGYPASSPLFFSSDKLLPDGPSCISGGDRRFKRMIKNRESAARSRARKQAYTNELELKVTHLSEENTKLKKQNEELRLAMAAQLPKRKALQRTSSALF